ncbi:hypothetical protein [Pseudonocardia sp. NPDC049635]|uniref:hypothetical protein n=1 Tax=Pseudonocardia sp. NPDC049635 TaxID=3155506 RepID=UPI00340A0E47
MTELRRAERWLLQVVRLVLVLTVFVLVITVPITVFATFWGHGTGYPGALTTGLQTPVRVVAELPPGSGADAAGGPVPVTSSVPLASLPLPVVVGGVVLTAVALLFAASAAYRLLLLTAALTGSSRIGAGDAQRFRSLARWVLAAGVTYSVATTSSSWFAARSLPGVLPVADLGWLWAGAGLAALLLVVSVAVRTATVLQDENDLTV